MDYIIFGEYTDGAPSMLDITSGLIKFFKYKSPEVISIHCLIHRQLYNIA